MNLKKFERYLRVNLLGPGPLSYKRIIYRAAVSQRLGNTGLRRVIITTLNWKLLPVAFFGNEKTKLGKVKRFTHIRRRMQYILKEIPGVISQARKIATPSEIWNCLITGEILDNVVQQVNQDILIQPNFSSESDAKLQTKLR
jgi:hypothetical protein